MQFSQVLAVVALSYSAVAAPAPEAASDSLLNLGAPLLNLGGNTVSCKSGNVYCSDGSKKTCTLTQPGQTCSSGEVICCNSAATLINLSLLPVCGNKINISVPVTVSALNGNGL